MNYPTPSSIPFGRHRGQPLGEVPSSYLRWCLSTCKLSSGLRAALSAELSRRGIEPPAPPEPSWQPQCSHCQDAEIRCHWLEDRIGRRHVRAECKDYGRFLGHPPSIPPYSTMADEANSPTALLDVMVELESMGVNLHSDGRKVWLPPEEERFVPPKLRGLIHSCSNQLARLMGPNLPRDTGP